MLRTSPHVRPTPPPYHPKNCPIQSVKRARLRETPLAGRVNCAVFRSFPGCTCGQKQPLVLNQV